MARTRVIITIDTECREERHAGGKLLPAAGYDLRVWGRFSNQRRELGIRLLMDILERHDLQATFYVEPLGSAFFGMDGLREICQELLSRGHDPQLHLHPIQQQMDWISKGTEAPSDDMADYSVAEQVKLLRTGMKLLETAGVPSGHIVSFRAGNFGANNDTWDAMAEVGLRVSSNYNVGYADKGMRMTADPAPSVLTEVRPGLWELPITNIRELGGRPRHLQITALSFLEMRDALLQAHATGMPEVTIVTHSFEFLHLDSAERRLGRLNVINVARLRALSAFLQRNADMFEVTTVQKLASTCERSTIVSTYPWPRGKLAFKLGRFVAQAAKRMDAKGTLSLSRLRRGINQ